MPLRTKRIPFESTSTQIATAMSSTPVSEPAFPTMQSADLEKENVLIVDDSATMRASFVRSLSRDYQCFQADAFMDALDRLREREFAVVITDIQMPGISGVELLRKIVDKYPDTSVIMV